MKAGSKVKCINNKYAEELLNENEIYTIKENLVNNILLKGKGTRIFGVSRFKKVN